MDINEPGLSMSDRVPVDGSHRGLGFRLVHEQFCYHFAEPAVRRIMAQPFMPKLINIIRRNFEWKFHHLDFSWLGEERSELFRKNGNQIRVRENRAQPDKAVHPPANL